jgi:hypothetical protein
METSSLTCAKTGGLLHSWQVNLPEMWKIAPNLLYALPEHKHVASSDVVVFRAGYISLIKL